MGLEPLSLTHRDGCHPRTMGVITLLRQPWEEPDQGLVSLPMLPEFVEMSFLSQNLTLPSAFTAGMPLFQPKSAFL